jgi:hypothetical protein
VVSNAKRLGLKREELLQQAEDGGLEMPVPRLIRRLNDPTLSEEYRDKLAAVVAPYCSPRLNAVAILKRPAAMTDEELTQLLGMTEEDLLRLGVDRDKHKYPYEIEAPDAAKH